MSQPLKILHVLIPYLLYMAKNITVLFFFRVKLFFCLPVMLRKIFNMYSMEYNGNNKILSLRQFLKMGQEFFQDLEKTQKELEIIYAKITSNKLCDFMCFIEILYYIHKENLKQNKTEENLDKKKQFKYFMDQTLVPKFKSLASKLYEFNIEKIQIFFQNYSPYENPIVGLFYESHNFLKHVNI